MTSPWKGLFPLWVLNIFIPSFKAGIDRDDALNLNGDGHKANPLPQGLRRKVNYQLLASVLPTEAHPGPGPVRMGAKEYNSALPYNPIISWSFCASRQPSDTVLLWPSSEMSETKLEHFREIPAPNSLRIHLIWEKVPPNASPHQPECQCEIQELSDPVCIGLWMNHIETQHWLFLVFNLEVNGLIFRFFHQWVKPANMEWQIVLRFSKRMTKSLAPSLKFFSAHRS